MAIYVENGLRKLINGRPLKAISHYWRMRIAEYQSMLNGYGLKTSKRLRLMYSKWRRQARDYIDYINAKVRQAVEWLYDIGVSTIKVGYRGTSYMRTVTSRMSESGIMDTSYGESSIVAEEYGIKAILVNDADTSSKCPIHGDGDGCGARISRGLFRCTRLNKVFNADLATAYSKLMTPITPSPERGRGNGPETWPGIKPSKRGDVIPNLLT